MNITDSFGLKGKTILVTGASSGIGRSVAEHIVKAGGRVVITGRNEVRLNETFQLLDTKRDLQYAGDLTSDDFPEQLAAQAPQLDGMVYCAGFVHSFPIKFLNDSKIRETMRINFESAVLLTSKLLRLKKFNNRASLLFLSSISSEFPHKGGTLYCASKAALETFTKTIAVEYAHQGIRANYLRPGMVITPMYDKAKADASSEVMDAHIARYPLGPGQPEDIALAALYFLSPASRWVTGTGLIMDGGLTLDNK
ncbi:MAG: SDR family oxidoreductase [Bacteroidetes bacterium]|jgi:NAD(P)-dependent dehydrogenase (short-subunit alcohol dehydrogenase family)|nr:SDR family oxidoreductase [Bacteroidota bacterium]